MVQKVEDIGSGCIDHHLNISLGSATASQNEAVDMEEEQEEQEEQEAPSDREIREEVEQEVSETEGDEIRDYSVVWGRVQGWPWWPGLVSPGTRKAGRRILRKVVFFGEDDRGVNTHSYLVSGAWPD